MASEAWRRLHQFRLSVFEGKRGREWPLPSSCHLNRRLSVIVVACSEVAAGRLSGRPDRQFVLAEQGNLAEENKKGGRAQGRLGKAVAGGAKRAVAVAVAVAAALAAA